MTPKRDIVGQTADRLKQLFAEERVAPETAVMAMLALCAKVAVDGKATEESFVAACRDAYTGAAGRGGSKVVH